MKKINVSLIMLLALLVISGTANANTMAHWQFEEGTAGVSYGGGQDDWYQDSSGNGNHLSNWWADSSPTATSDTPFANVPQTGASNNLALHFDGGDDLYTHGGKMIDSYSFNSGWTIEASFKADVIGWSGIIGKDGFNPDNAWGAPQFSMKIRGSDGKLETFFVDDTGRFHSILSQNAINTAQWYSVAATYDNSEFKVYIKGENDADYILQESFFVVGLNDEPTGVNLNLEPGRVWTVGRGMWNNNVADFFTGAIDEVRISDTALAPNQFTAIPEPATMIILGLGSMIAMRRKN